MMRIGRGLLFALVLDFLSWPAPAATGLKVYVSVDMEGVAGVVTGDQLGPQGFEYERFRGFMTNEALAAIEGARAAGATVFLVSDSHGNGENLLIERFPKDVEIVRSWPRPLAMMEGIDGTFDAAIFVGYHSSTTSLDGVRAHTMSSANLADVRLNGVSVPEAGMNAAIAGHFGVPVVLITGDDAIVKEAQALLGPIEGAVVKRAISFHAARTLTPEASCDLIREKAKAAVSRARAQKPYRIAEPVTLDVRFKNYRPSQLLAYLPSVERTDAHSIRFHAKDILEASRFLEFALNYEPGLSP
jgi:D-amino peptidase